MKSINVFFFVLGLFVVNTISAQNMSNGKKIYETRCLVCHQADGGGVPNTRLPLLKSITDVESSIVVNRNSPWLE